jgi:putative ATPase
MDLFRHRAEKTRQGQPLAERVRPATLEAFAGQLHLVGSGKLLERIVAEDRIPSMIFWGPPGTGKTTLARIIAKRTGARFHALSAVGAGVKEIREIVEEAASQRDLYSRRSLLFIDEIHRFNKAQQDALLPHVEAGTVTLIGATTENPSFEVISALLSRCRVLRLEPLTEEDLVVILRRALVEDPELEARKVAIAEELLSMIAKSSDGDARRALTSLEVAASLTPPRGEVTRETLEQALQRRTLLYDKAGEEHYNIVSAFIKSLRGSDPDAAVYWMVRMLEAGEDPLFIVRRMVIFASEDVGNADPLALQVAVAALESVRFVGIPEAVLPMSQAATYLATATKSNAALNAYARARHDVLESGPLPVPLRLRNAPTSLMRAMDYGKGYKYPHEFEGHYVPERYLPDVLLERRYYTPSGAGHEAAILERMKSWEAARAVSASASPSASTSASASASVADSASVPGGGDEKE